jgi:transposase-like protein
MPKSRPPYPAEFRRRMVELVRAGRRPEDLAQEFEPSAQAIRNWVAQAERDEGHRQDGLTTEPYKIEVTFPIYIDTMLVLLYPKMPT